MEDENRKDRTKRPMQIREKTKDSSISAIASGDAAYKSLIEGYNSNQEDTEATSVQEDYLAKLIRILDEHWNEMYKDEYIKIVLDKMAEIDEKAMRELKKEGNHVETINKVTREGNIEEMYNVPLLHETIHYPVFGDTTKNSSQQQSTRQEQTFSTDYDKYNEQLKDFLDYVALTKEIEDSAFIRVQREGNSIRYGRLKQGFPIDNHEITMTSNDDLRNVYEELKTTFEGEFSVGSKHTFGQGWTLLPIIGEKVMIEIDSRTQSDRNWIYEECHNSSKSSIQKKK